MYRIIESIELEYCTIAKRNDGIIEQRFVWDTPYSITAKDLIEMDETIKNLCQNKRHCILTIPGLYGLMADDAKKINIFKKNDHAIAVGLVIQSLSQRLLANFFFKVNKAPFPVKFFKNEEEATKWLLQHTN